MSGAKGASCSTGVEAPARRPGRGVRLAERVGFEPTVGLRLHLISSQERSTGLRHLSAASRIGSDPSRGPQGNDFWSEGE